MRGVALSQRERDCGRVVCIEDDPEIRVRSEDGQRRASFNGLLRCGHVWTCAPCSQRIRARQAKRIGNAVEYLKGAWAMLTITLRHDGGMPLASTLRALKRAWRRMRQRRAVRDLWKAIALAPVTSTEITYGENGWHPHLHVALQVGRPIDDDDRRTLSDAWERAVLEELGTRARPSDRGLVWSREFDGSRELDRALYVAKLGIELEVADPGMAKRSRSHWEIARTASRGDARAYALWIEYCRATKGLHMLQVSPEASDAAKRGAFEKLRWDDDIDVEPENIRVPTALIRRMRARERALPTVFHDALLAAERGGARGFEAWAALEFPIRAGPLIDYAHTG